jgi:hypothetical protein
MSELRNASIDQAQSMLADALGNARAAEDRELASQVRDAGDRFVRVLSGTLAMSKIHDLRNRAFDAPVAEFAGATSALHALLGPVHLVLVEGQVYVNDIRIRFAPHSDFGARLCDQWNRHRVGGLVFHRPVTGEQVRSLVACVASDPDPERPRTRLQAWLVEAGVQALQLEPLYRFRTGFERERRLSADAATALEISARAVSAVWDDLAAGRSLNALPVRKAMTHIADMSPMVRARKMADVARDRSRTAITRHTVQVATLSLMIGREVGLSEQALSDLGVCAGLHDAGYVVSEGGKVPTSELHATLGTRLMLAHRGFHEARVRRMLAVMEHHEPYASPRRPSLFARILRIADDYDTLTRLRPGGALMPPPTAVRRMHAARGTLYDPHLLQLFINRVGAYPPGCMIALVDGRWVVVISGVRSPGTFDRPLCLLVRTVDGRKPPIDLEIDLATSNLFSHVLEGQEVFEAIGDEEPDL